MMRISLTGPDDKTSIAELKLIAEEFPFVEWAILYVPHNEGVQRNPVQSWRQQFVSTPMPGTKAVHLCGTLAFNQLLGGDLPPEIPLFDRIQLNVNARKNDFSDSEVMEIFEKSLNLGPEIILQMHKATRDLIIKFLGDLSEIERARVSVLLDESRGTGKMPGQWFFPNAIQEFSCGAAGGIGPENISSVLERFTDAPFVTWVDMESGVRTDNEFDRDKARIILAKSKSFIEF